jgi:hypothetical protein
MARAKQPVSVAGIEFDALIELEEIREAEVPSYPVEDGFEVSDTIILKPLVLSMTLFLTRTGVTWKNRLSSDPNRVANVLKKLEELYFKKTPVTVITSDKAYENMAILSVSISKKLETGAAREIPISFQQIRVTESATVTIPASYGKSGATGTNAGAANTTNSSAGAGTEESGQPGGSKSSMLYSLAQSAGLFGG